MAELRCSHACDGLGADSRGAFGISEEDLTTLASDTTGICLARSQQDGGSTVLAFMRWTQDR